MDERRAERPGETLTRVRFPDVEIMSESIKYLHPNDNNNNGKQVNNPLSPHQLDLIFLETNSPSKRIAPDLQYEINAFRKVKQTEKQTKQNKTKSHIAQNLEARLLKKRNRKSTPSQLLKVTISQWTLLTVPYGNFWENHRPLQNTEYRIFIVYE